MKDEILNILIELKSANNDITRFGDGYDKSIDDAIDKIEALLYENEPDKRYLVFGYDDYYANGGLLDICTSFDTIEECKKYIKGDPSDNHEIYDRVKGVDIYLDDI